MRQCQVILIGSTEVWLKWYTDGTVRGVALFTTIYAVFVLTSVFMTAASMVSVSQILSRVLTLIQSQGDVFESNSKIWSWSSSDFT